MTYEFRVQIDIHEGKRPSPTRLARAVARALEHARESDIEGAEILDSRIGQITVRPHRAG